MKKYHFNAPVILLSLFSLLIVNSGCSLSNRNNSSGIISNSGSLRSDGNSKSSGENLNEPQKREVENQAENKKTLDIDQAPALTKTDFIITDNAGSISLGEDWKGSNFSEKQGIKEIGSNFVGNPFENVRYKTYVHDFGDFKLYITDFKNIEDYSISQIDILSGRFRTSRGVKVGSLEVDIQQKYGAAKFSEEDGCGVLSYSLDEYYIDFVMDNDQVKLIRLGWIPRNLENEPESGLPKLY